MFAGAIRMNDTPDSYMAASLWLERLLLDQRKFREAEKLVAEIRKKHGEHRLADDAVWELARALDKNGRRESALNYYRLLYREYPGSEFSERAVWEIGLYLYAKGRYLEAAREFRRGMELFPRGRFPMKFCFWQAKALEQAGKLEQAAAAYSACYTKWPDTYYGFRGKLYSLKMSTGTAGGKHTDNRRDAKKRSPAGNNQILEVARWARYDGGPELLPGYLSRHVEYNRGLELFHCGLLHLADREFIALMRKMPWKPLSRYIMAVKFHEIGRYNLCTMAAEEAIQSGKRNNLEPAPLALLQLAYPRPYSAEVQKAAARFQLEPNLIYALMREESRFNQVARSKAGAIGLMQLMFRTARGVARTLGFKKIRQGDLHRPALNIALGSWFISHQIRKFDNNPMLAVAAYNGGPTNLRRWLRRHQGNDMDYFLETIPFQETRSHVRKVFQSFYRYNSIWGLGH